MNESVVARGNILGTCVPARYIMAILGSIGMAIVYGLKVNLSVAMVAMLNHTAIKIMTNKTEDDDLGEEACLPANNITNKTSIEEGPFIWSEPLQGTLLSCYFWGYLVSQIPGAMIAEKYSAKWVMLFSVAINVVCTLLTPPLTKFHYTGLIIMRVLEGIGGGATFPAMHCLLGAWAPPNERSVMSTIVYIGTAFGTAKSILLSGVLAANFGWESVFYVMGALSVIWMVLWVFLVQDNPNKQTLISPQEREFITSQLGTSENKVKEIKPPTPWLDVLKSIPFMAILVAHVCSNWGWYMFLIEIPFYMKQVLHFDVSSNAVASALPYYPMLIVSICLSKFLDTLRAKEKITTTTARKIATGLASLFPAIFLLTLCYIGCRHTAAVIIMSFGIICMGGMFCGFLSNHIDLSNNYAGTLVALTNTVATLPGIIVPIFVGFITKGNQNIHAWRIIFYVTIVLFVIELVVYSIFGSGEEQSWNKPKSNRNQSAENDQYEATPLKEKSKN